MSDVMAKGEMETRGALREYYPYLERGVDHHNEKRGMHNTLVQER